MPKCTTLSQTQRRAIIFSGFASLLLLAVAITSSKITNDNSFVAATIVDISGSGVDHPNADTVGSDNAGTSGGTAGNDDTAAGDDAVGTEKGDRSGGGDAAGTVDGDGSAGDDVKKVKFNLDSLNGKSGEEGNIVIAVHPQWAPKGAERFLQLVNARFFSQVRFFRVVPHFIAQFGISGDPQENDKWVEIPDDPVEQSNQRGFVTFATAGRNTRTTQLFINFKDNAFLDSQGFAPFAQIVEGLDVIDRIYDKYGEQPSQFKLTHQGNEYLSKHFPLLTYIRNATLV